MTTWTEEYDELITRARSITDASDPAFTEGLSSRLGRAVREALNDPDEVPTRKLVEVMDLLARVPFHDPKTHEFPDPIERVLLAEDAPTEFRHAAARALVGVLQARGFIDRDTLDPPTGSSVTPREDERAFLLRAVDDETLPVDARYVFAMALGKEGNLRRAKLVAWGDAKLGALKGLHEALLGMEPGEEVTEALYKLYTSSPWVERRIVLSQVSKAHLGALPALVLAGMEADDTTLKAIIRALGRIGHVCAEPLLIELLGSDRGGDIALEAARALGEDIGTRNAMSALDAAIKTSTSDASKAVMKDAMAKIAERHPAPRTESGALTLVEEGTLGGALTLSDPKATEGDIELYDGIQRTMRDAPEPDEDELRQIAKRQDAQLARIERWTRLPAAPRSVPPRAWLFHLFEGSDKVGSMAMRIVMFTMFAFINPEAGLTGAVLLGINLGAIAIFYGIRLHMFLSHLALLRRGTPGLATLESYVALDQEDKHLHPKSALHTYTYSYVTEDETLRTHVIKRDQADETLSDDPYEPLLYDEERGAVVLFDEIRGITLNEDGSYGASKMWAVYMLAELTAFFLLFILPALVTM